jgi:hypothetical protein
MQLMLIHIYYLTILVLTAVGTAYITYHIPTLERWYNALKTRNKRTNDSNLSKRVADLEEQVNNLAEQLASRDKNRKGNIRRDVRDYLTELKTK